MSAVKVDRGNYDDISTQGLEHEGREPSILIRDVELVGDYPHTVFQFRIYDRPRDLEQTRTHPALRKPHLL